MALFDGILKCARCRDKGLEMTLACRRRTVKSARHSLQSKSTPTYRTRKEKEQKKMVAASPVTSTPILVDPTEVKLLQRVEGGRVTEEIPAGKKKRSDEPSKPSKKKSSSKPASEDLKGLDNNWAQRFAQLEAMLLAKP